MKERSSRGLDIERINAGLDSGWLVFDQQKFSFRLMTVGVDSANFQLMRPTEMLIRTGFKEGKVKFSRVLFIEKCSEISTASGVTSSMVPIDRWLFKGNSFFEPCDGQRDERARRTGR
jgi:hypothetical protein